jgi:putative restriction endonuclease
VPKPYSTGSSVTKAVFTTKVTPVYDDLPEVRYHFPKTYLNQVSQSVGDWIVYYEPRRATGDLSSTGGRQVYFATARVESIYPDPARGDHFYAEISNYLPFVHPVPFRQDVTYFESILEKSDGTTNKGAFGRAVRNLPDREYDQIWQAGFAHVIGIEKRVRSLPDVPEEPMQPLYGFSEGHAEFIHDVPAEQDRRIVQQLVSRPFRDKAFSSAVKDAYRDTCAVTGLKIINGGGRSEVQAAHIKPVEKRGPDSIRNALALSGTIHWMFDRGLISVDDDYSILLTKDRLPDVIERLITGRKNLLVPSRPDLRPHPKFLDYHRREIFKG